MSPDCAHLFVESVPGRVALFLRLRGHARPRRNEILELKVSALPQPRLSAAYELLKECVSGQSD